MQFNFLYGISSKKFPVNMCKYSNSTTVWGPILGRVQLLGMFHSFELIVNSLINWKLKLHCYSVYKVSRTQCMQFQPSARIQILEKSQGNVACPSPF